MFRNFSFTTIGLFCLFLISCSCENKDKGGQTTDPNTPPPVTITPPPFDADSALVFAEKQCSFGARVPNSAAHIKCGDWLVSTFKRFGAEVTVQPVNVKNHKGETLNARNIIASFNPAVKKRVMLTAHWDSRPQADADSIKKSQPVMGANDGASGVAVLLEIARQLQAKAPTVGVDIILWDAEDGGQNNNDESWCLGSQYWAKSKHKADYQALYGVNLDMVGAKGAVFPQEENSLIFSKTNVDNVWSVGHQLGHGAFFSFARRGPILDDHYFVSKLSGIPCIDIIHLNLREDEQTFFPHWHTNGDTPDKLDKATLNAVGQTVLAVVLKERL